MTRLLFLVVYDQYGGTVDATFMCVCTHSDTTATAVCAMAQFCAGTAYTRIDSITPAFTAETHDVFIQQQPHEPVCMVVCLWLPLCCCDLFNGDGDACYSLCIRTTNDETETASY